MEMPVESTRRKTLPEPNASAPRRPRQGTNVGTQRERVPVLIFDQPRPMARQVARHIANLVEERQAVGQNLVLGLPTGSTPIGVYQHLIQMHQEGGLDLSNVVTFNLDEYFPIDPQSLQSYHRFMRENFFNHVNIPDGNIHIPRGDIAKEDVEAYCLTYEHEIEKAGGIDLMLLGIGRSGHIGFNEPGSSRVSRTRLVVLDEITRKDAASDFFGEENVPQEAITMGVGTILGADEIILMATGEHKAPIIQEAVEGELSRAVTATYLQEHGDTTFYVDRAAAGELTREKTPWVVQEVDWQHPVTKRAVLWLSQKLEKSVLQLEKKDFHRNHLHGLTQAHPDIDALCQAIFDDLRGRITYGDDLFADQRVIVFSPHPDDDVISMGGMLRRLVENGNDVDVAYMTNGSVAVFDGDVKRHLRFVKMSAHDLDLDEEATERLETSIMEHINFIRGKEPAAIDTEPVQRFKAHIRYTEAINAIEVMGLHAKDARFLDMPFYKTGRVRKDPIGEADVEVVLDLLEEVQPDHIFVAGDLSDPHGTHRMCYKAIREALEQYRRGESPEAESAEAPLAENGTPRPDEGSPDGAAPDEAVRDEAGKKPLVWLYRGAWQEWETDRADVFIPLSKTDLRRKIEAIFKHESQKDRALFPGAYDDREFWQRARDRNRRTAQTLDELGLPEFYAAEAFVTSREM
jgi:glucosamine-6-phosphate deaminase